MQRIILIRPGATEFDEQRRILGTLDVPLSEEGNCEVDSRTDQLRGQHIQMLYCSPCESAQQTAEIIAAKLGVKWKTRDQLQNIDYGLWQGKTVEEVKRKQPKVYRHWQERPEAVCPPEGEMLAVVLQRLHTLITKILKKHKDATVGIVAPEPLATLLSNTLRQQDIGDLLTVNGEKETWEVIDIEPATLSRV